MDSAIRKRGYWSPKGLRTTGLTWRGLCRARREGLHGDDEVLGRRLQRVLLGAVQQQLTTTGREEVAQPAHEHGATWRPEEKQRRLKKVNLRSVISFKNVSFHVF